MAVSIQDVMEAVRKLSDQYGAINADLQNFKGLQQQQMTQGAQGSDGQGTGAATMSDDQLTKILTAITAIDRGGKG